MSFLAAAALPALKEFAASSVAGAITGSKPATSPQQSAINTVLNRLKLQTSKPADPEKPGDVPDTVSSEPN